MFNDKIIRATFLISLIGHCAFLGMPLFNMRFSQVEIPQEITVKVDIERPQLLPKIDNLGEEKKLRQIEREPAPPPPEKDIKEIIVEKPLKKLEKFKEKIEIVNPDEEAMFRYQDMVKQRIEQVRRYPVWAKKQGFEGTVYIKFIVLSNGLSRDVEIIRSSGYKILDDEAVATIQRANPFPPIPPKLRQDSAIMEVSVVFTIK